MVKLIPTPSENLHISKKEIEMKIKLVSKFETLEAGSVIEVSDNESKSFIDAGHIIYTEDVQKSEQAEEIKNLIKEVKNMSTTEVKSVEVKKEIEAPNINVKPENVYKSIGKALTALKLGDIKEITLKATGANEGTAADGGNLVFQLPDSLQEKMIPYATVYNDCRKVTDFPDGVYGRPIPYKNVSTLSSTSAPRTYEPGEGAAVTVTKLIYGIHDLKLGSDKCYSAITHELLSDVSYIENDVVTDMVSKLYYKRESNIMKGVYSAGVQGCIGITHAGASNFLATPVAHNATYTGTIIAKIISGIDPRIRAGAKWYMSNSTHVTLVGLLGTGTTVSTQPLFSNNNMTLAGYPIVIVPSMATFGSVNDILLANLAEGYTVAQKGDITIRMSDEYLFNTDERAFLAVIRYQGAPTLRLVQYEDGVSVGALSTTSGK